MTKEWIEVGLVEDIPRLAARIVETAKGKVAVFRTGKGDVLALHDRCPHKGGPLSEGIVHGHFVTCPLHNWVIDLTTGEAVKPDVGCVPTVPAKVVDGRIYLHVAAQLKVAHG